MVYPTIWGFEDFRPWGFRGCKVQGFGVELLCFFWCWVVKGFCLDRESFRGSAVPSSRVFLFCTSLGQPTELDPKP